MVKCDSGSNSVSGVGICSGTYVEGKEDKEGDECSIYMIYIAG